MNDLFFWLAVGAGCGLAGQGIRILMGFLDQYKGAPSAQVPFNLPYLLLSLLAGAVAGSLSVLMILKLSKTISLDADLILGLTAAGYVGADVIETILTKYRDGNVQKFGITV